MAGSAKLITTAHTCSKKFSALFLLCVITCSLNSALGYDVSGFNPDGFLPEIPPTNASQSARDRVVAMAHRENLTIRQLAQRIGSYGGLAFVGTQMEQG